MRWSRRCPSLVEGEIVSLNMSIRTRFQTAEAPLTMYCSEQQARCSPSKQVQTRVEIKWRHVRRLPPQNRSRVVAEVPDQISLSATEVQPGRRWFLTHQVGRYIHYPSLAREAEEFPRVL